MKKFELSFGQVKHPADRSKGVPQRVIQGCQRQPLAQGQFQVSRVLGG
jgi:hypothetical protein